MKPSWFRSYLSKSSRGRPAASHSRSDTWPSPLVSMSRYHRGSPFSAAAAGRSVVEGAKKATAAPPSTAPTISWNRRMTSLGVREGRAPPRGIDTVRRPAPPRRRRAPVRGRPCDRANVAAEKGGQMGVPLTGEQRGGRCDCKTIIPGATHAREAFLPEEGGKERAGL